MPLNRPARLFVALSVLFAGLAAWFVPGIEASGDEPHYLVMAQSLWREHDLDLRDNYAREDWREYRTDATEPHYAAPRKDGRPFPGHSPGLPFLLAPVYDLGGRLACAILMGVMVAGIGALAFWIASKEGLSGAAALLAGVLAAGPPLSAFGLHIYTEAPAALCLFGGYALLRFGSGAGSAALAGALACALPFLHPRMAAGSVALAAAAFLYRDRNRALLPAFLAVSALGATAYGLFWMSIFGVPTALGVYGGVPEDAALNPLQAFLGLLLDRAYGVLPIAPILLFLWLPRNGRGSAPDERKTTLAETLLVLAVVVPPLFWRMWWGGQSPPARLIAPMTPFIALWAARRWPSVEAGVVRALMIAASAWSWALFLFAALQPARLLFINKRVRPTRLWDALWPGGALDGLLPDLARPESSDWMMAAVWSAMLAAGAVVARRAYSRAASRLVSRVRM